MKVFGLKAWDRVQRIRCSGDAPPAVHSLKHKMVSVAAAAVAVERMRPGGTDDLYLEDARIWCQRWPSDHQLSYGIRLMLVLRGGSDLTRRWS
jgi:hypothetical protein